jgi:hypothetical protein
MMTTETYEIRTETAAQAPATFTVRALTAEEMRQAGGAGLLLPAVQKWSAYSTGSGSGTGKVAMQDFH